MATTISDLAARARKRGIEQMGEAAFARLCMHFANQLPPAGQALEERYVKVLQLMVAGENPIAMQLGLCWLDANGYGQNDIRWLHYELVKVMAL